jgi:hypothetical protein
VPQLSSTSFRLTTDNFAATPLSHPLSALPLS